MDDISNFLCDIIDYIELTYQNSKEKDNLIFRLKEAVFWATYLSDGDENVE